MRKNAYKNGDIIGKCVYLNDYEHKDDQRRHAMFRCECGNLFHARIQSVKSQLIISCGCINKRNRKKFVAESVQHNLSKSKYYKIWYGIKERCLNTKSQHYDLYGGNNLIMHPSWIDDFISFYEYITALPEHNNPENILVRINVKQGYVPDNLQWASWHINASNQKKKSNNTSGYTGVSFVKRSQKWVSEICVNGEHIRFGTFDSLFLAVRIRNNYIIKNKLFEYPIQTFVS